MLALTQPCDLLPAAWLASLVVRPDDETGEPSWELPTSIVFPGSDQARFDAVHDVWDEMIERYAPTPAWFWEIRRGEADRAALQSRRLDFARARRSALVGRFGTRVMVAPGEVTASQHWLTAEYVQMLSLAPVTSAGVALRTDCGVTVIDGHHHCAAAWARGDAAPINVMSF
jgi:hypothetical protein